METLIYSAVIKAPKAHVWEVMLSDATYRVWTGVFHEGSHFVGSWDTGSEIRFLAEDDGKLSGIAAVIAENRPDEYISIEYTGEIADGQLDDSSDEAEQWIGAHENYHFTETDGVTTLTVELIGANIEPEMSEMFDDMWPKALAKLKEICEIRE